MIRAIVFDFDGLIIDTETLWYTTLTDLFAEHDCTIPLHLYGQIIGTSNEVFDVFRYLEEQKGAKLDRAALKQDHERRFRREVGQLRIREGVASYISEARALGLRIGLASSSPYAWIEEHLPQTGLSLDVFEAISTGDLVERVKPDPALYNRTLNLLGVAAHEAVAFEDSPNGAKAAKAAGMYCVAVPNEVTRELEFGHVDLRIHSMAELSLQEVIKRIS